MNVRVPAHCAGIAAAALVAALLIPPTASARTHVGIGISVPGVAVGVGNCWNCGYRGPVGYYGPVYPAPVYPVIYPPPVAVYPAPVYYGYGYYPPYRPVPYYRPYYYGPGYGHPSHGHDHWHH